MRAIAAGRGRRLILGSTAVVVILFATLLVAEGVLRVYHHLHPSFVFSDGSYNRFRGRPFAADYDFKLNSRGFKDLERPAEKPPGAYRILAIGDSFVFGVVPYRHNFTTVLERDLNDRPQGGRPARFEVINMGIPDTGPREYLAILVDEGLAFSPDLVIVCVFFGNDLRPVKKAAYEYSHVASLIVALFQARHFPGLIVHGLGVYRDDAPSFSPDKYMELVVARSRIYVKENPGLRRGLPDALVSLTRIRDICRERRIELLVVGIPDEVQVDADLQREVIRRLGIEPSRIDFTAPNRVVADELRQRGIRYLDLLPSFRGSAATRLYKPRDSHWNIAGNRRAAEAIAAHISVPSR